MANIPIAHVLSNTAHSSGVLTKGINRALQCKLGYINGCFSDGRSSLVAYIAGRGPSVLGLKAFELIPGTTAPERFKQKIHVTTIAVIPDHLLSSPAVKKSIQYMQLLEFTVNIE
ncbi:hypothetical protein Tco_1068895 [Tanacetum coccineum]|uniref:Uncharacterized protein n=1 Tax=Tanacetum coccineum TaxID=301880 RepID=A0ABQ5HGY5_9ASTR